MGTRIFLNVNGACLAEWKEGYDPRVLSIFTEDDRRSYASPDDERGRDVTYEYAIPAAHARERLEVTGFTRQSVRTAFDRSLQALKDELGGSDGLPEAVRSYTVDRWLDMFRAWSGVHSADAHAKFADDYPEWECLIEHFVAFGFPSDDPRHALRALLDTCLGQEEVTFDFSDFVADGYLPSQARLVDRARADQPEGFPLVDRLVVLTEGSTDAQILQDALCRRRPHLLEFVAFPDFVGSNAEGGSAELVRTVRSFVSAGIRNRAVAVFDNDTAGAEALRSLHATRLPSNIRVIRLPPLPAATNYPTAGPQGEMKMDVNGLACSLELYLGADVLDDGNGSPARVQWKGFNERLNQYQGEVLHKRAVRDHYFKRSRCNDANRDWAGLDLVLDAIVYSFSN